MSKLNPRDWVWTSRGPYDDPAGPDYFFGTLMGIILGLIPFVVTGALTDLFLPTWASVVMASLVYLVFITNMFWMPRVNRWHGIEHVGILREARAYRALPKRDRQEFFPSDFEKVVKRQHLMTQEQKVDLYNRTRGILYHLEDRNRTIAAAALEHSPNINLDDFFEAMDRGREYAKIEATTLKEFI